MALVIRSLATDQIQPDRSRRLLTKELSIGILNGSVWGLIVGGFAVVIYSQIGLGLVMTGAVVLNLVVAAVAGVLRLAFRVRERPIVAVRAGYNRALVPAAHRD